MLLVMVHKCVVLHCIDALLSWWGLCHQAGRKSLEESWCLGIYSERCKCVGPDDKVVSWFFYRESRGTCKMVLRRQWTSWGTR